MTHPILDINNQFEKTPNRIQANWSNWSTTRRVVTIAINIALIGATVAAFIWGGPLLTGLVHLSPEASAIVLNAAIGGLGLLGFGASACAFLKKSNTEAEKTSPLILAKVWKKTQAAASHAKAFVIQASDQITEWRLRHSNRN